MELEDLYRVSNKKVLPFDLGNGVEMLTINEAKQKLADYISNQVDKPVILPKPNHTCENCRFWFISPLEEESKRLSEDDSELHEICNCEQSFVCDMPTYSHFGCIQFEQTFLTNFRSKK